MGREKSRPCPRPCTPPWALPGGPSAPQVPTGCHCLCLGISGRSSPHWGSCCLQNTVSSTSATGITFLDAQGRVRAQRCTWTWVGLRKKWAWWTRVGVVEMAPRNLGWGWALEAGDDLQRGPSGVFSGKVCGEGQEICPALSPVHPCGHRISSQGSTPSGSFCELWAKASCSLRGQSSHFTFWGLMGRHLARVGTSPRHTHTLIHSHPISQPTTTFDPAPCVPLLQIWGAHLLFQEHHQRYP